MRHVAGANQPYWPVAHLAAREPSLQALPVLRQLSARMSAKDFLGRAANAYATWPKTLLAADLDRIELASAVRRALFPDDREGWEAYAAYVRQKVDWFGLELDETTGAATSSINQADASEASELEGGSTKTGWPWTPIA